MGLGKSRTLENLMASIVAKARGRLSRLLERGDYRRPRLVSYACRVPGARCTCTRAPCAHAHGQERSPRRSGTAMRDLVPLRRSTFELGLPRSQLCPYGRPACNDDRECTGATRLAHLLDYAPALLPSFLPSLTASFLSSFVHVSFGREKRKRIASKFPRNFHFTHAGFCDTGNEITSCATR